MAQRIISARRAEQQQSTHAYEASNGQAAHVPYTPGRAADMLAAAAPRSAPPQAPAGHAGGMVSPQSDWLSMARTLAHMLSSAPQLQHSASFGAVRPLSYTASSSSPSSDSVASSSASEPFRSGKKRRRRHSHRQASAHDTQVNLVATHTTADGAVMSMSMQQHARHAKKQQRRSSSQRKRKAEPAGIHIRMLDLDEADSPAAAQATQPSAPVSAEAPLPGLLRIAQVPRLSAAASAVRGAGARPVIAAPQPAAVAAAAPRAPARPTIVGRSRSASAPKPRARSLIASAPASDTSTHSAARAGRAARRARRSASPVPVRPQRAAHEAASGPLQPSQSLPAASTTPAARPFALLCMGMHKPSKSRVAAPGPASSARTSKPKAPAPAARQPSRKQPPTAKPPRGAAAGSSQAIRRRPARRARQAAPKPRSPSTSSSSSCTSPSPTVTPGASPAAGPRARRAAATIAARRTRAQLQGGDAASTPDSASSIYSASTLEDASGSPTLAPASPAPVNASAAAAAAAQEPSKPAAVVPEPAISIPDSAACSGKWSKAAMAKLAAATQHVPLNGGSGVWGRVAHMLRGRVVVAAPGCAARPVRPEECSAAWYGQSLGQADDAGTAAADAPRALADVVQDVAKQGLGSRGTQKRAKQMNALLAAAATRDRAQPAAPAMADGDGWSDFDSCDASSDDEQLSRAWGPAMSQQAAEADSEDEWSGDEGERMRHDERPSGPVVDAVTVGIAKALRAGSSRPRHAAAGPAARAWSRQAGSHQPASHQAQEAATDGITIGMRFDAEGRVQTAVDVDDEAAEQLLREEEEVEEHD